MKQMRPNADAWSGNTGVVKDEDVVAIRVVPDEERGKYEYTGYSRIERDLRYFGHVVPVWLKDEERFIYPDELPEGKFILPLATALWKKCCTKEGDKEESWEIVTIVVTGQLSDMDLKSFADGELTRLYEETDGRLVLPEVLSERIRRYVLAKTGC